MKRRSVFALALLASIVLSRAARADVPCATGADYEPIETRCDGLDNDCDGLVDVLLPVAANECWPGDGSGCARGHAACVGGQRACLAPGPAPEVVDGADNDCNGVLDDVPPAAPTRARALLLVPGYVFDDAPLELDEIASILDQWGIAYDRPAGPGDFNAALDTLASYPLVIIPGYLEEDALVPWRQALLESYAAQGGVLVVFKPIFDEGSATHQLIGTSSTVRRFDVDAIAFDGPRTGATRAFDSPEELRVPINAPTSGGVLGVHVLTPAPGDAGAESLATALVGGVPVGSAVTRRRVGLGSVYALGHDLHVSFGDRCYINCFEPGGDSAGLFLREAFREGTRGHLVLKHTVPGPEDSVAILSHDSDALDAQQPGAAWGDAGGLQVASLERQWGARGSFFVTTDDVLTEASVPYYSPELVRSLCALDMCPVGAHSVVHGTNFGQLALGTCAETIGSYAPDTDPTLCGDIRVSLDLLAQATGTRPVGWRSPYLAVNPLQYDVLASEGALYDSSFAVGDLKSNLPVSLARTGTDQYLFHGHALYTAPIVLEDGIGGIVEGVETREEMSAANAAKFTTLWTYAMLRNADNGAHTLSLMHPSYGRGQPQDNVHNKLTVLDRYLAACRTRGVRTADTVADLIDFWRAREEANVDARYLAGRYDGTVTTGAHAARNFTLEFGDAIARFDCAGCGPTEIAGKRVTFRSALPPAATFAFSASVGSTPPAPPAVPAAGRAWLAALAAILLGVGVGAGRRGRGGRRAGIVLVVALSFASPAAAQTSPYCTKVRERATDDAALLMAPRLQLQGLRFPSNGQLKGGTVIGNGFQVRAGMAFSATDLYKGVGVLHAADADCREHEARLELETTLIVGDDDARRAALDAEIAFLDAHRDEIHGWVRKADARFAEHVTTLIELADVRARAGALDRKLAQARGQAAVLRTRPAPQTQKPAHQVADAYTDAATGLVRAATRVRAGDPWQLDMTAGIIPSATSSSSRFDWYGIVQLGFNLGGLLRHGHAASYARAREQELATAPYEAAARLRQRREALEASREQGAQELALIQRELEDLDHARQVLAGSEAPNILQQRERLALELVAIQADRAYYRAYVDGLGAILDAN